MGFKEISEEEIKSISNLVEENIRILCSMADDMDDFFGEFLPKSSIDTLNGNISDSANKEIQKNCYHFWNNYTGLTESYQYCSKCDAKKPVNNESI